MWRLPGNSSIKRDWQGASPKLYVGEGNFCLPNCEVRARTYPNLVNGAGSLPVKNLFDWQSGKLPARPKHS